MTEQEGQEIRKAEREDEASSREGHLEEEAVKDAAIDASVQAATGSKEFDPSSRQAPVPEESVVNDEDRRMTQKTVSLEALHEQVTLLQEELEKAKNEAEENFQKFLRAQADLENFRRRTRQESEAQAKYAAQPLIEKLLPALDNFERAINAGQQSEEESPFFKGIEMVFRQLKEVLESQGLKEIEAEGKKFDPHLHEAVMKEPSDEVEEDVVTEVLQKGYYLNDRVIRPAMVKVSG